VAGAVAMAVGGSVILARRAPPGRGAEIRVRERRMKKYPARVHSVRRTQLQRVARRLLPVLWYTLAVIGAFMAIVFASARLLLPAVTEKKAELEKFLSTQSGYTVRIEQLSAYWDGLHPGLQMQGIEVFAADPRAAVRLAELRISLKLFPLLIGNAEIHSAVLTRPSLAFERLADGRFRISGFSPFEETDVTQSETFVTWLFRQSRISIEDGDLQWVDRREAGPAPRLTHVNLQLLNSGERHRLGLSARFPEGVCDDCSLVADIEGNPFRETPFAGEIYLRGRDVNVEAMPRIIREYLPPTLRGVFSVELWSKWEQSRPISVDGDVAVSRLRLPLADLRAPLSVKQATTRVHWKAWGDGFEIALDDLTLALHGAPWAVGKLEFARRAKETLLHIGRIELADVTAFVASLRLAESSALPYEESAALWTALKPAGVIKDLRVQLSGALDAPEDYALSAVVEALSVEPYQQWPGVRGAGGKVSVMRDGGELVLDLRHGTLAMPHIFRAPLPIERATAHLHWERQSDQWRIVTDDIVLLNEDAQATGRLTLQLPQDSTQSPALALNIEFRDANGNNAARYYPVHHVSSRTLAWMERAFGGGSVTAGTLVYNGRTRDFPFSERQGTFELHASVRDAVYRYLPGWEPITGATANVTIRSDHFVITAAGRIGALTAGEVVVTNDDADKVRVRANVAGPIAESLRVLRAVQSGPGEDDWRAWLSPKLEVAGNGLLSLDLTVPLDNSNIRLRGEYRFILGALRLSDVAVAASAMNGSLRFTEKGVHEGRLRMRILGDEAVLAMSSPRANETVVVMQGRATAAGLAPLLGPKLAPQVSGAAPWDARLRLLKDRRELTAEVDLAGLNASLPAPLNRPGGLSKDKLIVRTEAATRDSTILSVTAGALIQGRIRVANEDGWHLHSGRLVFNEMPARAPADHTLPTERGLQLLLRLDDFNLDQWLAYVDEGHAADTPGWLARVGAYIQKLTVVDRDFGRMSLDLAKDKSGWAGPINGTVASGRLRFATRPATLIELDLARLLLPLSKDSAPAADTDPRKLPHVTLKSKSFQVKDKELGELEFIAHPVERGWKIERLVCVRPEARFEADGLWRMEHGQAASEFKLHFSDQDLGQTMAAFGVPDEINGGEVALDARLAWAGAPGDFGYTTLSGDVQLDAKKGRFLQLRQGAGRMFGILDLSAIGRYLTLDFSPIFGKGFAFDHIQGSATIERGNATTRDFQINGPSARIQVHGNIGLAAENFDLVMDVYPSLTGGVALTSLLAAGPQVALWALLVQRLFKKQIEEGTRVTYMVKGPWSDPSVTRKVIEREKTDAAEFK